MTSWERIERVASVIRHAPSGGFSQGGSIVVTDSGTRAAIADASATSTTP